MKLFKLATLVALTSAALSASAFTAIDDSALSQVSGQDGVSIAADLNINVGSFKYTDTDATGGSVSFNNIGVRGLILTTIDILNGATFQAAAGAAIAGIDNTLTATQIGGILTAVAGATGFTGQDVVQIAIPTVNADARRVSPTITVGSITTGGSTASFGSFAINNLDMQGTKVWMWAH